jgi:hypothetical protein
MSIIALKRLANRLENATSIERLDALTELQTFARNDAQLVGEYALQKVLDLLKEQGSAEEYQESLDLIDRLIKNRDKEAVIANSGIILSVTGNIELLLDLLEHEDLTVGVMASQILTEIHATEPLKLESCIQDCPDGMNKLLQRLPDGSREEIRNQAIVLIQQLTVHNEEMKKTVVFNEGFEFLFNIINGEGGCVDAGLVIQDCLQICRNILQGNEICQRLFFGMGIEWILKLQEFFDPEILETLSISSIEGESGEWFDQPGRINCAVLALNALAGALEVNNSKHQNLIAFKITSLIPITANWIARKGPNSIVQAALLLLSRVIDGNAEVASQVANMMVKINPLKVGKHFPFGVDIPLINFGFKPLPTDDRKFVTVSALLAERYVFCSYAWKPISIGSNGSSTGNGEGALAPTGISEECLLILEKIFSADSITCDLMIQYILAPPPPSMEEEDAKEGSLESMRPLGSILLSLLVDGCARILSGSHMLLNAMEQEVEVAGRSANILSLLFIYGGQLARELSTVITTGHLSLGKAVGISSQSLLPYLLSTAGRAARIPVGGHTILVAILRLLSGIVSGCDVAARQMLDDPSNFFVVDLATTMSESAGTPLVVQVAACFFLGTCFTALKDPLKDSAPPDSNEITGLTQKSFLNMIESRIGLTRFNEILKLPLKSNSRSTGAQKDLASDLFFSNGFKVFYESHVEYIKNGIFQSYVGTIDDLSENCNDASLKQLLQMQKEKIIELESRINNGLNITNQSFSEPTLLLPPIDVPLNLSEFESHPDYSKSKELMDRIEALNIYNIELKGLLATSEEKSDEVQIMIETLTVRIKEVEELLNVSNGKVSLLQQALVGRDSELDNMVRGERVISEEADQQRKRAENAEKIVRMYEQQHQQSNMKALKGTSTDNTNEVIKLQEECRQLLARAERAESSLELKNSSGNNGNKLGEHEGFILKLKENILRLDSERATLTDRLEQRDRKIELLEEDLRGPVPFEMAREKKISDLERRNADLTQQLWAAEADLQSRSSLVSPELALVPSPSVGGLDEAVWRQVAQSAQDLFIAIGMEDSIELTQDATLYTGDMMINGLHICGDTITHAVNEMSDISESMGLKNLGGSEGSIQR